MNENFQPVSDDKLEARITAYVLGEASSFEAADIESLIAESAELQCFANRLRILDSLLKEAETTSNTPHPEWNISLERRTALDPIIGAADAIPQPIARRSRHAWYRAAISMAAVFLIALVIIRFTHTGTNRINEPLSARNPSNPMERPMTHEIADVAAASDPSPALRNNTRIPFAVPHESEALTEADSEPRNHPAPVAEIAALGNPSDFIGEARFSPEKRSKENALAPSFAASSSGSDLEADASTGEGLTAANAAVRTENTEGEMPADRSDTTTHRYLAQSVVPEIRATTHSPNRASEAAESDRMPLLQNLPKISSLFNADASNRTEISHEIPTIQTSTSTFHLDVPDTSFRLALSALQNGAKPDPSSIHPEQFYNAFAYDDPPLAADQRATAAINQSVHPVLPDRNLIRISILAAEGVDIRVTFNPDRVRGYKLIGFDGKEQQAAAGDSQIAEKRIADSTKHPTEKSGTAMYQIEPLPNGSGHIGEVTVRFTNAPGGTIGERRWTIPYDAQTPPLERAARQMQLATLSMLAAQKLQGGPMANAIRFGELAPVTDSIRQAYPQATPLITLIQQLK